MISTKEFKNIEAMIEAQLDFKLKPLMQRLDSLVGLKEQVQMNQEIMLQISKKLDVNTASLQGTVNSNSERLHKVESETDYLMQRDAEFHERRAS